MSDHWVIEGGWHCTDCGRLLRTLDEYNADLCDVCRSTTHVFHRFSEDNARAAWEANKDRHRQSKKFDEQLQQTLEVVKPAGRKFRIK